MGKLTKAQRAACWIRYYRDGRQNDRSYEVNTVWTKFNGGSAYGLKDARDLGFIVSAPDDTIRVGGWRHDITPAGRQALAHPQAIETADQPTDRTRT